MAIEDAMTPNQPPCFFDDSAVFDELAARHPLSIGIANNTQFAYDAQDRCVKIEERSNSTLTSTKQFTWCGTERCEERDASGNLVTQFFPLGYKTGGNSFYYNLDHLGSVREVTNTSAAIVTQASYTPWGEASLLQGSTLPDFGYARYYNHPRSGLNLTLYRAYSPGLGRWLSRDPIGENGGINLYAYCGDNPISRRDPRGTDTLVPAWPGAGVTTGGFLGELGAAGLVAGGIIGLPAGIADIASGRPGRAILSGVGTLTGPGGWFGPRESTLPGFRPTSCERPQPLMSEGLGPIDLSPGGVDAPSEPGVPYPGELGPIGPGEGITPGGKGAPPDDSSSAVKNQGNREYWEMINNWNKQYYGHRPPSWD